MILAIDVFYGKRSATAAGVIIDSWTEEHPIKEIISSIEPINEYEAGSFYKRELPCILKLLEEHRIEPDSIIIDGHVLLDGQQRPGLGKHLFDSLNKRIPVVGVAKNAFKNIPDNCKVFRGTSKRPLFVTSIGIPGEEAKSLICSMHGANRIPTILKRADQLCRQSHTTKE